MRHGARIPVMRYGSLGGLGLGSLGSVQSVPRIMREPAFRGHGLLEVPLEERPLGADFEFAEECMRPGEILLAPGVCGPDVRRPVDPYAAAPPTLAIPVSTTKAAAAVATVAKSAMDTQKLLILGAVAVAAIYLLGRR